jgi:hypothetical protein
MRLSHDDILKIADITTEEVEVPEWHGSVLVRGLTGKQRDIFESTLLERRGRRMIPNTANIRAKLVAWSVVDDEGNRVFTDAEAEELGEKSAAAVDRIYTVASRLSGLSDEDVEELAENFASPAGNGSFTASPKSSAKPSKSS